VAQQSSFYTIINVISFSNRSGYGTVKKVPLFCG